MATTSSFLNLSGGGEVRLDYLLAPGSSSVAFQLLDPAGQAVGPLHLVHEARESSVTGGPFTRIDNVGGAALSSGGFVLTYEERSTPIEGPVSEFLTALVFDADGVGRGVTHLQVGTDLGAGAAFAGPGAYGLSDDRYALVFDQLDGSASSRHLSVQAASNVIVDVMLRAPVVGVNQSDADLALTLSSGDRVLVAGSTHTTVLGGAGADIVIGGGGVDYLRGDAGNDSIVGGSGFDDINGNQGNDTCVSGGGDDWVVGGKDNDSLSGSDGQNLVYGNLGNDTCDGGGGNDIVRGGQDNDVINGGAGDDFVSGDKGDDTVTGGTGADIFHTFGDAGLDRVLDFNRAEGDRVMVDPGTQFTVAQVGADTVISMTGGGQVILVNVQMSTLTGDWIFGA